jgi:hypothetical protein
MAEKPGWINDQPVTLDIDGLRSFSDYIQQELDTNVRPNVNKVIEKLGQPQMDAKSLSFGSHPGYYQGQVIGNFHAGAVEAMRKLLDDLQVGLQAIAWAARNIANDFQGADELNSMDLTRVDGYFQPKDHSRSLDGNRPPQPPADQA